MHFSVVSMGSVFLVTIACFLLSQNPIMHWLPCNMSLGHTVASQRCNHSGIPRKMLILHINTLRGSYKWKLVVWMVVKLWGGGYLYLFLICRLPNRPLVGCIWSRYFLQQNCDGCWKVAVNPLSPVSSERVSQLLLICDETGFDVERLESNNSLKMSVFLQNNHTTAVSDSVLWNSSDRYINQAQFLLTLLLTNMRSQIRKWWRKW